MNLRNQRDQQDQRNQQFRQYQHIQQNRRKQFFMVALFATLIFVLTACSFSDIKDFRDRKRLEAKIISLNNKASKLIDEGKNEQAIANLKQAIEYVYQLEPDLKNLDKEVQKADFIDPPFNNIALAYNQLRDYEQGLEYIEKALLILPNTDEEFINKGNALYGLGEYEEALACFEQALKLNPKSELAFYGIGSVYYNRNEYREAAQALESYIGIVKNDLDATEMIVGSYLALDEYENAKKASEEALKKDKSNPNLYNAIGLVYSDSALYEESLEYFEKTISLDPDFEEGYINKLRALHHSEKYEQCIAEGEEILKKINPGYPDIPWYIGACQLELGNANEAIAYFQQAIDLDPEDAESFSYLAYAYSLQNNDEKAEELARKALELDSADDMAQQVIDSLEERKNE